jgi:hypothetical protein
MIEIYILRTRSGNVDSFPNLSRFLQKLGLCIGENAEVLRNHLKQAKLNINKFGIDHNSREAVTFLSSFTGKLVLERPNIPTRCSTLSPSTHWPPTSASAFPTKIYRVKVCILLSSWINLKIIFMSIPNTSIVLTRIGRVTSP